MPSLWISPRLPIISTGFMCLARPSRSTHGFPALEKPRLRPRQDAHHWTGIHTFAARWELPSAPAAHHAGREKGTKTTWALEHIYIYLSLWYHVYVYIYIWLYLNILNCIQYKSLPNNHCKSWTSNVLEFPKTRVIGPPSPGGEVNKLQPIITISLWHGAQKQLTSQTHLASRAECDPVALRFLLTWNHKKSSMSMSGQWFSGHFWTMAIWFKVSKFHKGRKGFVQQPRHHILTSPARSLCGQLLARPRHQRLGCRLEVSRDAAWDLAPKMGKWNHVCQIYSEYGINQLISK